MDSAHIQTCKKSTGNVSRNDSNGISLKHTILDLQIFLLISDSPICPNLSGSVTFCCTIWNTKRIISSIAVRERAARGDYFFAILIKLHEIQSVPFEFEKVFLLLATAPATMKALVKYRNYWSRVRFVRITVIIHETAISTGYPLSRSGLLW